MFVKKPRNKRFEYTPRYYNPQHDPEERRKRRMKFESNVRRGKNRPIYFYAILLILAIILYSLFTH